MKLENAKKTTVTKYLVAISVAVVTFITYLPALQNAFVNWDDNEYVYNNLFIRALNGKLLVWAFTGFYEANWHPLTWISHALDWALWGPDPLGHHLTNNILHAFSTGLVVLVSTALLKDFRERTTQGDGRGTSLSDSGVLLAAGVTGLLFGIHPLHVESVAWVSERKDILCALFFIPGILSYVRYVNSISGHEPYARRFFQRYYLVTLGFFFLALLSKPMAVSFPVVILILDWCPFQRIQSFGTFRSAFVEKVPFIAMGLCSSGLTIAAQSSEKAMMSLQVAPLLTRILVAGEAIVSYLAKMVLPINLSPFYPYPQNVSFLSFEFFFPLFVVAVITATSIAVSGRWRLWLAVWAYYLATLLPVIGVIQVGLQSMADRYTYLPALGPFLLAGLAVSWAYEKVRRMTRKGPAAWITVALPGLMLLALMSYLTVQQIGVWRNSFTLWTSVIEKSTGKVFFAYMNRGIAYDENGQYDLALSDYDTAAAINPLSEKVYDNRAVLYSKLGYFDRAIQDSSRAISINPDFSDAYNNRGIAYGMKGLQDAAIEDFTRALALDPRYLRAFINRGNSLVKKGSLDKAVEDYTQALAIDPEYANAYAARGLANLRKGEQGPAVSDLRNGCSLGNDNACRTLRNLVNN